MQLYLLWTKIKGLLCSWRNAKVDRGEEVLQLHSSAEVAELLSV